MAKHITKSVIEDIAYQIKRVGLITDAYERGVPTEEMVTNFGPVGVMEVSGTDVLDWIASNLEDIFADHDPTFSAARFREQCQYRIEI